MRWWLKELRAQKGWSQAAAAKKMNVTRQAYSLIECGARQADLNLSTAQKISEVYGVPLTKIGYYEQEMKKTAESEAE